MIRAELKPPRDTASKEWPNEKVKGTVAKGERKKKARPDGGGSYAKVQ